MRPRTRRLRAGQAVTRAQGGAPSDRRRAGRAGQGGERRGSAVEPRAVRADRTPGRPGRAAGVAGRVAGARADSDPLWADAGVAVHVLPRRRAADGRRSGRHPQLRAARPALRRRPPVELRRVRLARTAAGLRPQRLRRDAAGTLGVGSQAAGRELRGGRTRERLSDKSGGRSCSPPSPATARRCASSPGWAQLDVWYARLEIDELFAAAARPAGHKPHGASAPRRRWPRRAPATACRRSRS